MKLVRVKCTDRVVQNCTVTLMTGYVSMSAHARWSAGSCQAGGRTCVRVASLPLSTEAPSHWAHAPHTPRRCSVRLGGARRRRPAGRAVRLAAGRRPGRADRARVQQLLGVRA